ncbi:hypothetical protein QBC41DRAFT_300345 [Cercophora samala]|uniref:Uncharacterized protein n=1 Tax=Cercophora samala TaxID=330535 RepID=A0AA39ZII0_9PEZI|nr:hypothetical protein QBC41DRAFT_300345 [Cercophora samala]
MQFRTALLTLLALTTSTLALPAPAPEAELQAVKREPEPAPEPAPRCLMMRGCYKKVRATTTNPFHVKYTDPKV